MAGEKNYSAPTGVSEFYYGVLENDGEATTIVEASPERVKFLQDITVGMTQTIERAWGDNEVAELAVSSGPVTVTGNFHKIPRQDKDKLLGLEVTSEGLSGHGNEDNPPYVAVIFRKTHEDGSNEWVGLPKGKFLKTDITATSKQDTTTFSQDGISAEFMNREVAGFNKKRSVVSGFDESDVTVHRDAIFQAVFGQPYPGDTVPEGV